MKKFNYFVQVTTRDGEFEKTSSFLIGLDSGSKKDAEEYALSLECHHSLEKDEEGNLWDGNTILSIATLKPVPKKDMDTLREYLGYCYD